MSGEYAVSLSSGTFSGEVADSDVTISLKGEYEGGYDASVTGEHSMAGTVEYESDTVSLGPYELTVYRLDCSPDL